MKLVGCLLSSKKVKLNPILETGVGKCLDGVVSS